MSTRSTFNHYQEMKPQYKGKRVLIKVIASVVAVGIGLPTLLIAAFYGHILYLNLNPDHVALNKDGWIHLISFVTETWNVKVDVYTRPKALAGQAEFVVVRHGALPLGFTSISPIYRQTSYWGRVIAICRETPQSPDVATEATMFSLRLGELVIPKRHWFAPIPSVFVTLTKACSDSLFSLSSISYSYCQDFPSLNSLRFDKFFTPPVYGKCMDFKVVNQPDFVFLHGSEK